MLIIQGKAYMPQSKVCIRTLKLLQKHSSDGKKQFATEFWLSFYVFLLFFETNCSFNSINMRMTENQSIRLGLYLPTVKTFVIQFLVIKTFYSGVRQNKTLASLKGENPTPFLAFWQIAKFSKTLLKKEKSFFIKIPLKSEKKYLNFSKLFFQQKSPTSFQNFKKMKLNHIYLKRLVDNFVFPSVLEPFNSGF